MDIGIIGKGVVGEAVYYGLSKLGHKMSFYDPAFPESRWEDILNTEINFICVPTIARENGSCDVSIVEDTIQRLVDCKYSGIAVIKSTVVPGTTQNLINKYALQLRICFVPEFLRERCAESDFVENHDVCIIGCSWKDIFEKVKSAHGRYPKKFIQMHPTEAEFCKYFNNVYNATLVTFANSMYEVCHAMKVDYTEIKNAMVQRDHITDIYLDCNPSFRGYSGMCLVKDCLALSHLAEQVAPNVEFFKFIDSENNKYPKTVWEGMRMD